jgi:serine/threonine protein kinase
VWRRIFSSPSSTTQPASSTPTSKVVDVEAQNQYRVGGFHPVELSDVLSTRYRVVRKLGYGQYSTVWLVEDSQYVFILTRHLTEGQENIWPSKFYRAPQPKAKKGATSLISLSARQMLTQTILDTNISSFCWTTSSRRDQTESICAW